MITLTISEARAKLANLVDQVDEQFERLFITKNGKAKAVLISSEEFESWIETIASYQDKETLKRNQRLKKLNKRKLFTLKALKEKLPSYGS